MTGVQVGDIITFAGQYNRRSLWQWITRQPKRLRYFKIKYDITSEGPVKTEDATT